jgi:hypothetical protein
VKQLRGRFLPSPVFLRDARLYPSPEDPNVFCWRALVQLKRGWLYWPSTIAHCRLYLIRKDFGPLNDEPEGISLEWTGGTSSTLEVGKTYEAAVIIRDRREGIAYIAKGIRTGQIQKKWPLRPGRGSEINDPVGRYTFWLEVRTDKKRWRSRHFYVVRVPPPGHDHEFALDVRAPLPQLVA